MKVDQKITKNLSNRNTSWEDDSAFQSDQMEFENQPTEKSNYHYLTNNKIEEPKAGGILIRKIKQQSSQKRRLRNERNIDEKIIPGIKRREEIFEGSDCNGRFQ